MPQTRSAIPAWSLAFSRKGLCLISAAYCSGEKWKTSIHLFSGSTRAAITAVATNLGLVVREFLPLESAAQTVVLGPFVIFELLLIRLLRLRSLSGLRTNILAVLQKPPLPSVSSLGSLRPASGHAINHR